MHAVADIVTIGNEAWKLGLDELNDSCDEFSSCILRDMHWLSAWFVYNYCEASRTHWFES